MGKEYLTIDDLAEYLSVKRSTLYAKVESGEIPHYKVGRLVRFKECEIEEWLQSHRNENINAGQRAKRILKTARPRMDIDAVVKKSIEEVKNSRYNFPHGKSDRIKGLRKEVENGTL